MGYEGTALTAGVSNLVNAGQIYAQNEQALDEGRRRAGLAQSLPQDLAALTQAPGVTVTSPGTPEVAPSATTTPTGPSIVDSEGIERGQPEKTVATPGQAATPDVEVKGQTLANLVRRLGADTVSRLMSSDQGRKALADQGVLTEEEMSRRLRLEEANRDAKRFDEQAYEHAAHGRAAEAAMAQARAWGRRAEAAMDPNKAQFAQRMEADWQKQAIEIAGDTNAGPELQRFMEALYKFKGDPTQDNLDAFTETAAGMTSKSNRGYAARAMQNLTAEMLPKDFDPIAAKGYQYMSDNWAAMAKDGTLPKDPAKALQLAWNQAMKEHPETMGPLVRSWLAGKSGMNPIAAKALFGFEDPKAWSTPLEAARTILDKQGADWSDPKTVAKLHDIAALLNTATKTDASRRADAAEIHLAVTNLTTQMRTLENNKTKLETTKTYDKRQKQAIADQIADIDRQLDAGNKILGGLKTSTGVPYGLPPTPPAAPSRIDPGILDRAKQIQQTVPSTLTGPARVQEYAKRLKAAGIDPEMLRKAPPIPNLGRIQPAPPAAPSP